MWKVLLIILSILGIILLCLLGLLLLVLFLPVVYRGGGRAHAGEYEAWFRFRWFFGLVRGQFPYPDGKALRIKVLWLTVYDSSRKQDKVENTAEDIREDTESFEEKESPAIMTDKEQGHVETEANTEQEHVETEPDTEQGHVETEPDTEQENKEAEPDTEQKKEHKKDSVKAAQSMSEKLADLREKLQQLLNIIQDKDNQELVRHAKKRLGKLLKSIRPRVLRAEAVIGLGEPDTTGYLYGAYWTIKPFLGRRCRVTITPDFEQQILEGKVMARGYVFAAVLLYQVIRVILDRRLRRLISQLKRIK